jgi:hypothetical protein
MNSGKCIMKQSLLNLMHNPNICLDKMLKTTVTDKITDIQFEDRMWDL